MPLELWLGHLRWFSTKRTVGPHKRSFLLQPARYSVQQAPPWPPRETNPPTIQYNTNCNRTGDEYREGRGRGRGERESRKQQSISPASRRRWAASHAGGTACQMVTGPRRKPLEPLGLCSVRGGCPLTAANHAHEPTTPTSPPIATWSHFETVRRHRGVAEARSLSPPRLSTPIPHHTHGHSQFAHLKFHDCDLTWKKNSLPWQQQQTATCACSQSCMGNATSLAKNGNKPVVVGGGAACHGSDTTINSSSHLLPIYKICHSCQSTGTAKPAEGLPPSANQAVPINRHLASS
ncbi:hypothetical protein GQ44DRAFT_191331 [Phaeosphaeriaceae sp. PMI808]|nr:hypothetical protein GQ44DRAFT_191331 [Phaeosphaeriaceae sp. PMI808]